MQMADVTLTAFEADKPKRWVVERGIEIISEASRRLSQALKSRHPDIPWSKVAGIGSGTIVRTWHTMFFGTWCARTCRRSTRLAATNWRGSRRNSGCIGSRHRDRARLRRERGCAPAECDPSGAAVRWWLPLSAVAVQRSSEPRPMSIMCSSHARLPPSSKWSCNRMRQL